MGRIFLQYIENKKVFVCNECMTHLTIDEDIMSRQFHGRGGRAYLVERVLNVYKGPPEKRILLTGLHIVCDIFCNNCQTCLGWTYDKAYQEDQKYKENKFILEKTKIEEIEA